MKKFGILAQENEVLRALKGLVPQPASGVGVPQKAFKDHLAVLHIVTTWREPWNFPCIFLRIKSGGQDNIAHSSLRRMSLWINEGFS